MKRSKIVTDMVPLAKMVDAYFNPVSRTEKRALSKLKRDIIRDGAILSPISLVPNGDVYTKADGHRRTFIAKELGYSEVVANIYVDLSVEDVPQLWSVLNGSGKRPTKALDWLEASVLSGGLAHTDGAIERNIHRSADIFSGGHGGDKRAALMTLALAKQSPTIASTVDRIIGAFAARGLKKLPDHLIGFWLMRYSAQQLVKSHLRNLSSRGLKILHSRIEKNEVYSPLDVVYT